MPKNRERNGEEFYEVSVESLKKELDSLNERAQKRSKIALKALSLRKCNESTYKSLENFI